MAEPPFRSASTPRPLSGEDLMGKPSPLGAMRSMPLRMELHQGYLQPMPMREPDPPPTFPSPQEALRGPPAPPYRTSPINQEIYDRESMDWMLSYPQRVWKRATGQPLSPPFAQANWDHPVAGMANTTAGVIGAYTDYTGQKYDRSQSPYVPGERESTNVEDRRPTSIFSYW